MAYFSDKLVSGLSLYSARREQKGKASERGESAACIFVKRIMAWRGGFLYRLGLLNGIYQAAGDFVRVAAVKMHLTKRDAGTFSGRLLKRIVTFLFICFSWLFFRAGNLMKALEMIRGIRNMDWMILINGSLYNLGVPIGYFRVLLLVIIFLFWVDGKRDRGINVAERFLAQGWWFRVTAELALMRVPKLQACIIIRGRQMSWRGEKYLLICIG